MIGILTFQTTNNFGAYLHTVALARKVKELGYDCEVIDYLCPELIRRETASFKMRKSIRGIISYALYGRDLKQKYHILARELRNLTDVGPAYTPESINEANSRYSSFLLGSDVVWSLRVSNNDYNYFLAFADDDKKKLAFSSSVGETDMYRDDPHLTKLLNRFDDIAVREAEAVEWVKAISGRNCSYVCDPTMLYDRQSWDEILSPKEYRSDYVLIYFSDSQGKLNRDAVDYAKKHQLKIKIIGYGRPEAGMEMARPKSMREFVGLIKHCKALFTASYHGMLFGLYYERELFYYNRSFKARMNSLAKKFDILEHNGDNYGKVEVMSIDYSQVTPRIDSFRKESLRILENMLKTVKR